MGYTIDKTWLILFIKRVNPKHQISWSRMSSMGRTQQIFYFESCKYFSFYHLSFRPQGKALLKSRKHESQPYQP